jgi:hypothetical protein
MHAITREEVTIEAPKPRCKKKRDYVDETNCKGKTTKAEDKEEV